MVLACTLAVSVVVFMAPPASAVTLPPKFAQTAFGTGLGRVTAMAFAPDGRLFVASQDGVVRIIKNGSTLPTPFATVITDDQGERGLTGIAIGPEFATNGYVFLYYATKAAPIHNTVVRVTAKGDQAVTSGGTLVESTVLDLEPLSANIHNGGAMSFGSDGKLYISVGENAKPSNAQTLTNKLGKILRINSDGSIPTDNPFYGRTTGTNRAIWALGFRNPFTFAFQPGTDRMFVNDVGQDTWEEIDDAVRGGNYGWPTTEGPTTDARFSSPIYAYKHQNGDCAITGGTFYNPAKPTFPTEYVGDYFFADFCQHWIKRFDPQSKTVTNFAQATVPHPVDLKVGPDGSFYYLSRGQFAVYRVSYTGSLAPAIDTPPADQTASLGHAATFEVQATGQAPLTYQWQREGVNIAGATAATYTVAKTTAGDNGARFRVIVTNNSGSSISAYATLKVVDNDAPTATIVTPAAGSTYAAGDTLSFSGTGSDPEDGTLPASAFTWSIDLHHNVHSHPGMAPASGSRSGSYVIPAEGHTETTVFYRVTLTVKDSGGLTATSYVDVHPRKVKLTLASTNPAGLQLTLDGQPRTAPFTADSVIGVKRDLGAVSPQTLGGKTYEFVSWSDGGAGTHTVSTPNADRTYTANFRETKVATNTVDLTPTEDAYANSAAKAVNFGTSASLCSRGGTVAPAVSYLRFTLPAAPAGKTLTSVNLRYRTTTLSSAGSAVSQKINLASNAWSETDLNWNNKPGLGAALGNTPAATVPNTTYNATLDASGLTPKLGTTTTIAVQSGTDDNSWLWSREHGNAGYRPQLTLTFS